MVNKVLNERYDFQQQFIGHLANNGYEIIIQDDLFKNKFPNEAINRKSLMRFLYATQNDILEKLEKIYHNDLEDTIIANILAEESKPKGSRLQILKHGIDIANYHLKLLYTKPETSFNPHANRMYKENIFSVSEEVYATEKNRSCNNNEPDERVDLVIFLNGLAIIAIELKSNSSGQNYKDAIKQYRQDRNPKLKLFRWKSGALVFFAMDDQEVYMTTKLNGTDTVFLPFNLGKGNGIETGAGNPIPSNDLLAVHYMWDDILQKDFLIEIIHKFMFVQISEHKDHLTDKIKRSETIIFPRYHQLDVVRKLLANVKVNHTSQNYLIQHSAGSGKTNSIAWLSHRLASVHDSDNNNIFDTVIVCTDRVVVDRQLQDAIYKLEHKDGFIKVMNDKCTSADLKYALEGNTKIIATTIQKFPYIVDEVSDLKDKKFAVIIDEAHSSTAGKNMLAISESLGSSSNEYNFSDNTDDLITQKIKLHGKPLNVSFFAFTATPKSTTLQLFGTDTLENGKFEKKAFHLYSMKQAIEEHFILDVLTNYITYDTFYTLNKTIADDPTLKTNQAKKQIARFIAMHETNIAQRIEIIIEHFRSSVRQELNGQAKAMVVTESRASAVRYRQAFEQYTREKGYDDIKALVAFSGKIDLDDTEYTESSMNGFSEKELTREFDKDQYQILLVADKYQTGFDQPKLCAMYVLKKLHGINAVQTLSRLNRICPPFDKKTFILDFANSYDDIKNAFSKYYTTTILSNTVSPQSIYDLIIKIDAYYFLRDQDVDDFNVRLFKENRTSKDKNIMNSHLHRAANEINRYDDEDKRTVLGLIRNFLRLYEFLSSATCFEDIELHKKYTFLSYLISYIKIDDSGSGFSLDGKLKASGFVQKKSGEFKKPHLVSNPIVKLPITEDIVLTKPKEEKLSEIIRQINATTGKNFDTDVAKRAAIQVKDMMKKNYDLKVSAKNNDINDFSFAYYDHIDNALIDGMNENHDFFSILLNDNDLKKQVMDIFKEEIYKSLRN